MTDKQTGSTEIVRPPGFDPECACCVGAENAGFKILCAYHHPPGVCPKHNETLDRFWGCFSCATGRDEAEAAARQQAKDVVAAMEAHIDRLNRASNSDADAIWVDESRTALVDALAKVLR